METINKKLLQTRFERLAELAGLATSEDQANELGQDKYLHMEYAKTYGGYRLVMVNVSNGGHSGAFGMSSSEPRKAAKEMYSLIDGLMYGIQFKSL